MKFEFGRRLAPVRRSRARFGVVVAAWLAVVGLLGAVAPVVAHAQQTEAPAAWVSYAQQVGQQFQTALATDGDTAARIEQTLGDRVGAASDAAAALPAVAVRAWIGDDGAVTRIEFESLGEAQADASLRQLLTGVRLAPPPADMLQPLRVRLQLVPNPDAAVDGAAALQTAQ
ncbi:YbaB/EbfC family DNA-binding protein [Burkholderia perseverans]|uniref:YbaB/EbfC family DNA-binding protein n=1 Tax=Burkholderia perseverans TaxID=2615214 RepID=UPI001FF02A82|nr:YbaB/EbfC family DNA-binding protein [Burkholderia perseverans]